VIHTCKPQRCAKHAAAVCLLLHLPGRQCARDPNSFQPRRVLAEFGSCSQTCVRVGYQANPSPAFPSVILLADADCLCNLRSQSRRRYGHLTWEWAAGLRSYAHPLLFVLPFQLLGWLGLDSPATLPASALVMQGTLAAAADVFVFRLAKAQFGQQAARCCCASASTKSSNRRWQNAVLPGLLWLTQAVQATVV